MLSAEVPVFAWDRGGPWRDPAYYPRIIEGPATSVPYWDKRCGQKFADAREFDERIDEFWECVVSRSFNPRAFVLENLTLEQRAREYVGIAHSIES